VGEFLFLVMGFDKVEKKVLAKVCPSFEAQVQIEKAAEAVVSKVSKGLKKAGVLAEVFVGGSLAKGTNLRLKTDIDIFVRFDYSRYKKESAGLSEILEKVLGNGLFGKKIIVSRVHGSRDYFQLSYLGFDFEIVPILAVESAELAVNITDVTPLHVSYVNSVADKKLKKQICLSKQFAKASKCYGAESYIGGFSGYVLEILTIYYGSFRGLLEASLKWKMSVDPNAKKTVVDPSSFHKGKDVSFEIDVSKLCSPIVVVDPVDKWRNAAAALSLEKVKKFKSAAKAYLKSASALAFEIEKISLDYLKGLAIEKKKKLVVLSIEALTGKRDVLGCQLLKIFDFVSKELDLFGIDAKISGWEWPGEGAALMYFYVKKKKLALEYQISGPPVTMNAACDSFRKVHSNVFEDSGKLYAVKKRAVRDLDAFVGKLISRKYVSERCSSVELVEVLS